MLTLAKLGTDSASYYLGTAHDPRAGYYLGAGEPPGRWVGRGVELFGYERGEVLDPDEFRILFAGEHPDGSGALTAPQRKVPAFDLTASAPKSVSALWALGDEDLAAEMEAAHAAAVQATLDYLEREACRSRVGAGGVQQVRGQGLVTAAFQHRTSREGDPQLHTHLVIANVVRGPDGVWRTLDASEIYAHYRTAGAIYQAAIRQQVTRRLGVEWDELNEVGLAEIRGVPTDLLERWSTRRQQIEDEVRAQGGDLNRADHREQANRATRRGKEGQATTEELRVQWAAEAAELGHDLTTIDQAIAEARSSYRAGQARERVEDLVGVRHARLPEVRERLAAAITAALPDKQRAEIAAELADNRPTFRRHELIRRLAELNVDVAKLDAEADRVLAHSSVVELAPSNPPDAEHTVGTRSDNCPGTATTVEIQQAERRVLGFAVAGQQAGVAVVSDEALAAALARHPSVTDEQREMVVNITTRGDRVAVVSAAAGSGKSFSLGAARQAWETEGHAVIGCATAAIAASGLEKSSGIPSDTLAQLLTDLDRGRARLERGTVVVVDEASMVGTLHLERLANYVAEADGKIVLVGDPKQLSSVEAGGLFRQLHDEAPELVSEMRRNRRQRDEWQQRALEAVRDGNQLSVAAAASAYVEHGRVKGFATELDAKRQMVADYYEARDENPAVLMMAYRRADVAALNMLAYQEALERGELGEEAVTLGDTEWRTGARLLATRNAKQRGILNGQAGTVTGFATRPSRYRLVVEDADGNEKVLRRRGVPGVAPGDTVEHGRRGEHQATVRAVEIVETEQVVVVKLDDGQIRELPADYVSKHASLGYSTTTHKAQGVTVETALLYGQGVSAREAAYVGMSRGKGDNRLYVVGADVAPEVEDDKRRDALVARVLELTAREDQQATATELGRKVEAAQIVERQRLAAVLDAAPDEQAMVAAARDRLARAQKGWKETRARIEAARQRGAPTVALEDQLARWRAEGEQAHAAVATAGPDAKAAFEAWAAEQAEELARWDALTEQLRAADAGRVAIARMTRPAYLPEEPTGVLKRRQWERAVATIEGYRARWGVEDADNPLGPRPDRRGAQAREWDQAHAALAGYEPTSDLSVSR